MLWQVEDLPRACRQQQGKRSSSSWVSGYLKITFVGIVNPWSDCVWLVHHWSECNVKTEPLLVTSGFVDFWHNEQPSSLTLSLPRCHLKTTNKVWNWKVFTEHLSISMWKGFIKTDAQYWKWFVIGQENVLSAGACQHISARKFYRLWQWKG